MSSDLRPRPREPHLARHHAAMTQPNTEEEATIAALYDQLALLCQRYRNDRVLLPAIEGLGACLLRLAENGPAGRVDPGTLGRQVRALIRRAGGDEHSV